MSDGESEEASLHAAGGEGRRHPEEEEPSSSPGIESSSNIRDSLRERPTSAEQQSAADGAGSEGASTSLQQSPGILKKNHCD